MKGIAIVAGICAGLIGLASTVVFAADRDVVINEVMYHPPHDLDELQYLELHNHGRAPVNLSQWSFTKGIKFTFPEGTRLEPGGFLVVCRNRAAFEEQYGATNLAVGNFEGHLSHNGEKLELANAAGQVVEAFKYGDGWPWPKGPDGSSAALERIAPGAPADDPANWSGSKLPAYEQPAGTPGRRNDSHASNLPPALTLEKFNPPLPGQNAAVTVAAADADGIREIKLLHARARSGGGMAPEAEVPMARISGNDRQGVFRADLPAQPAGALVRFRLKAVDNAGSIRYLPGTNEPRPTFSYSTFLNTNQGTLAMVFACNIEPPLRESRIAYRRNITIAADPARGNGALICLPAGGGPVQTFDHVLLRPRPGGFKVHFLKDQRFQGMTGINIINEGHSRYLLSEPLGFELYRRAGVPAPLTDHVRVWQDGQTSGFMQLIEQPNKAFLARNQRDDSGELFKLLWYGGGLKGQHEKKTRFDTGHEELARLIDNLGKLSGAAQWDFIQKNFNVPEVASYYAVNYCLQNWDGFHNNYFTYHDTGGTGQWEIYPWDLDKTWGDYDGASSRYDWCGMPLTMGMRNPPPGQPMGPWWRPGGWFGEPLLSNPEFSRRVFDRLAELCETTFTEAKFNPVIDTLEKKLEPEVILNAKMGGADPDRAVKRLRADLQTFRDQVKNRRAYILRELPNARQALAK